jgi:hypothetical protein
MFSSISLYEKPLDIFGKLTEDTQRFILEMARNLLMLKEKNE